MLNHLVIWLKLRMRDDRGATMVEYGLLIVLIALVAAVGAFAMGGALNNLFNDIATRLTP